MKRKSLLLLFVSTLSAIVVGCSKPGEDPQPDLTNYADKIAGMFKGTATYGSSAAEVTTKALVKATGENVVEITVLDYPISETLKGDLVVSGVKVEKADEKNLSLSATTKATVEGKSVDVTLTGGALMGGENINFNATVSGYSSIKYSGSRYTNATGAELMSPVVSGICVISSEFDAANKVVTYKVPTYALASDLETLEATFTISDGASWVLKKGAEGITKASEAQKLTLKDAETTIEITAENGEKKSYTFKRESVAVEDAAITLINTYEGDILVAVGPAPAEKIEKQKVSVVRTASNTISFTVKELSFNKIELGDIVLNNVVLYKGQDEIALSGLDKVKINIGAGDMEVNAKVKGVYSISKKSITLNIDIAVDANLSVKVDYTGKVSVDPVATKPLFVSVSHSKILKQEFEKGGDLTYYVDSKYPKEDFKDMKFEIKLPEGATYKVYSSDGSDKEFDFTSSVEYYDVLAADGKTTKRYKITREALEFFNAKTYDFSEWTETTNEAPAISMFEPVGWQTPNSAVALMKVFVPDVYPVEGEFPVKPITGGKAGKAAQMVTLDTKGGTMFGSIKFPKVTSGTVYTGKFNAMAAMGEALLATEFGLLYNGAKPTKLKGWYAYTPGPVYYDVTTVVNVVDQPAISIILYDVTDDFDATITGLDTYTSSRIVAMGKINPASSEAYKEFTVDMTYTKEYDPAKKIYKLAMIMSASKDGHLFKGAPGSTLVVDEIEIVTE